MKPNVMYSSPLDATKLIVETIPMMFQSVFAKQEEKGSDEVVMIRSELLSFGITFQKTHFKKCKWEKSM